MRLSNVATIPHVFVATRRSLLSTLACVLAHIQDGRGDTRWIGGRCASQVQRARVRQNGCPTIFDRARAFEFHLFKRLIAR